MAKDWLNNSSGFLDKFLVSLDEGLEKLWKEKFSKPTLLRNYQSRLQQAHIVQAYGRVLYWINVVEGNVASSQTGGWTKTGDVYCSRRFSVVPSPSQGWILMSHDSVLMVKDAVYSHFLIHVYAAIYRGDPRLSQLLTGFLNWGDLVLPQLGELGYEVIKGVEALCTVRLVQLSEKWLDPNVQAVNMVQKYVDKEVARGGDGSLVKALWSRIASIQDTTLVAEYFGFMKLLGHPYVDPRQGLKKVQKLVFAPAPKSIASCEQLGFSVCHLYTRGYLKKTGNWPLLGFVRPPSGVPTQLEQLCTQHHPTLALGFTQYPCEDWRYAWFEPHLNFDMGEDVLGLLSDRALSYNRDEFDAVWMGKLDYKPPRPTTSKRALGEFISRQEFSVEAITKMVMDRTVPFKLKICATSPKEREMKPLDPRMFVKFPLDMRTFFNNVEKNTKQGVFKFLPEQTMTMDRQELIQRFLATTSSKGDRWVDLHVSIDFSSWNLCMDEENHSIPTGVRLDQIYGVPGVFTYCHEYFKESLSVLDSGDFPPTGLCEATRDDVLHGRLNLDTAYTGHSKGYEGIQQGPWTLTTVGMGHMAVADLGIPFMQSGQGDNQVYTFHLFIPAGTTHGDSVIFVRTMSDEILKRLNKVAADLGHEIKVTECICSTSLFTYGKEMFLDGSYLPASSKFISRIFPSTTADAPSIHEYLSSVSSGGIASTDKSNVSYPQLVVTKFVEHLTISRELKRSLLHGGHLFHELTRAVGPNPVFQEIVRDLLCIIPSNLGGLPISTPMEFLYRGHSDPLSSSLASLRLLDTFPGVEEYMEVLTRTWIYKDSPDLEGLILDPYALPIQTVPPPAVQVARAVLPVFTEQCKNRHLRAVIDSIPSDSRLVYHSWVTSMKPFYPKIAHELYKCSLQGVIDTFAKRFTNTRTLMTMTNSSGYNLSKVSIHADFSFLSSVIHRLALVFKVSRFSGDHSYIHGGTSIYRIADLLREKWGLGHLEGVTNQHPMFAGELLVMPRDHKLLRSDREIVVMSEFSDSELCSSSRGPVSPYLGSKTSDKSVGKWIKPVSSSPPLRDVIKILSIQSMMGAENSLFWTSLEHIAATRSYIDLDVLREFCRLRIGGVFAHRWQTRDDARGSFVNVSTNWPSHLTVSTNHAGALGRIDYPFDFQEGITLLQGLMSWWGLREQLPAPFGLVLQVDLSAMDPVADHIVSSLELPPQPIPTDPSYYTVVSQVKVSSRATRSALLQQDLPLQVYPQGPGSIHSALLITLFTHLTGNISVHSKRGKTSGDVSYRRIIDMPELSLIPSTLFRQCLGEAIFLKVCLSAIIQSRSNPDRSQQLFEAMVNTEVRRAVPSLYGTIRELPCDVESDIVGIGLGHADSPRTLALWLVQVKMVAVSVKTRLHLDLYTRGNSSISRSLMAGIASEALLWFQQDSRDIRKSAIELANLLLGISRGLDEVTKVRQLTKVITSLGIPTLPTRVDRSPQEVLRELRKTAEIQEVEVNHWTSYTTVLSKPLADYSPEGSTRILSYADYHPTPDELVASWDRREVLSYEAGVAWSPIQSIVPRSKITVLLIGIGDGFISYGLPTEWEVVGVDLGTTLAALSQSMVNYNPPHMKNKFTLHHISWALGGDLRSGEVRTALKEELLLGKYSLVIIDVDGVSVLDRLACRADLASCGVPVYCKVFVTAIDSPQLINSFYAHRRKGDRVWSTRAYPENEYVLGASAAPLGLCGHLPSPFLGYLSPPVESINGSNLTIYASPQYTPGQDIYILTGELPPKDLRPISPRSLKSLFNFVSNWTVSRPELLLQLLANQCPRSRVRAFYRLNRSGFLT